MSATVKSQSGTDPVAIVLGGSTPHVPLVEVLKRKGYWVVLVDFLENPVAKDLVDEHIRISTYDKDEVLKLALDRNAALVVNTSLDQPIVTACYVAEKLGLPAPFSFETALDVTDKARMKRILTTHDIPTSPYVVVRDGEELDPSKLKFPVVVKPVDGTGSLGVHRIGSTDTMDEGIRLAFKESRSSTAIVEEFMEGEEWNFYALVQNRKVQPILILRKLKIDNGYAHGMQQVGSVMVHDPGSERSAEILSIAQRIVDAFKIADSPLLVQFMVGEQARVIEFAARSGGTGLSTRIIQDAFDLDMTEVAVDLLTRSARSLVIPAPKMLFASNFIYAQEGEFGKVTGLDELQNAGIVHSHFVLKRSGMSVPNGVSSRNRVASFLVTAKEELELYAKVAEAMSRVDVLNSNGRSILRREMYLKPPL